MLYPCGKRDVLLSLCVAELLSRLEVDHGVAETGTGKRFQGPVPAKLQRVFNHMGYTTESIEIDMNEAKPTLPRQALA